MRNIIILILLFSLQITDCLAQSNINYFLTNTETYENQELRAVIGKKEFTLVNKDEQLCMRIEKIADFNKNGSKDVLIEIVGGCGGNCCANSYQIFSYNGKNFKKSQDIGYDWNGVEVSKSGNEFNFIIETINDGVDNTEMCGNKTETYIFKGYDFKLINVVKEKKLKAITEITSNDFKNREEEELFLFFDLDGDGEKDRITSSYWTRWGKLSNWRIDFVNGKNYKATTSPKRIGIMNTKTKGVHDIVIDCETILKWNGSKYE